MNDSGDDYYKRLFAQHPNSEERKKRKEAGCCEECGTLLPMSVWGLGECPYHPKPLPPNFKQ